MAFTGGIGIGFGLMLRYEPKVVFRFPVKVDRVFDLSQGAENDLKTGQKSGQRNDSVAF